MFEKNPKREEVNSGTSTRNIVGSEILIVFYLRTRVEIKSLMVCQCFERMNNAMEFEGLLQ